MSVLAAGVIQKRRKERFVTSTRQIGNLHQKEETKNLLESQDKDSLHAFLICITMLAIIFVLPLGERVCLFIHGTDTEVYVTTFSGGKSKVTHYIIKYTFICNHVENACFNMSNHKKIERIRILYNICYLQSEHSLLLT